MKRPSLASSLFNFDVSQNLERGPFLLFLIKKLKDAGIARSGKCLTHPKHHACPRARRRSHGLASLQIRRNHRYCRDLADPQQPGGREDGYCRVRFDEYKSNNFEAGRQVLRARHNGKSTFCSGWGAVGALRLPVGGACGAPLCTGKFV